MGRELIGIHTKEEWKEIDQTRGHAASELFAVLKKVGEPIYFDEAIAQSNSFSNNPNLMRIALGILIDHNKVDLTGSRRLIIKEIDN